MKLRRLPVMLLILMLTGCSTFGFLFDRLGWLATWQFDRMFGLNDQQEQMVEQGAEAMSGWLLETGFPVLVLRLSNVRDRWLSGQQQLAVAELEQQFERSISDFLDALRPHILPLLLSLDEGNAEHYRAYNLERQEDWFDYALSREAKVESRVERLENWFGSLSDDQEQLVAAQIDLLPNEYQIRLANNQHWKERFLNASLARDAAALEQWLADPSVWWLDDYAQLRTRNRAAMRKLLESLLPTLSAGQNSTVVEKVEEWIETLQEVIEDARD